MVLPFGPAEKQALLEAADTTARAKLLVAFLEMNAFGQASRRRRNGRIDSLRTRSASAPTERVQRRAINTNE